MPVPTAARQTFASLFRQILNNYVSIYLISALI